VQFRQTGQRRQQQFLKIRLLNLHASESWQCNPRHRKAKHKRFSALDIPISVQTRKGREFIFRQPTQRLAATVAEEVG
jgi:hypothetical protein